MMSKELIKAEKQSNLRQRKAIVLLWGLLIISILLDSFHCNILALIYNCKVEELLHVSDFYILSPIFGLVDLIIALMLLKKLRVRKSVQCFIELYERNLIAVPVIQHMAQILIAVFVAVVSICSLLTDLVKFFA